MSHGTEGPAGAGHGPWHLPGDDGGTAAHRSQPGPPPQAGPYPPPPGVSGGDRHWSSPPARPGVVPLRPLGLGEIYDGAFRAFRQNPRVMVGLSAIVVTVTTLLTLPPTALLAGDLAELGAAAEVSEEMAVAELTSAASRSLPALGVGALLQSVAVTVLNGLLILSVSRAVLGERIALGGLWRIGRSRVVALVGLALLLVLVSLLLLLVAVVPGGALIATGHVGVGVAVLLAASLLAVVTWVWLNVQWALAAPALLLEGTGVAGALRRSRRLVRGAFWRVLGIVLLTWIIAYAVITALAVPFSVLAGVVGGVMAISGGDTPTTGVLLVQQAIGSIGSIAASTIALPFVASVTALLYIDLRMRREGLDVELNRAAAEHERPERW